MAAHLPVVHAPFMQQGVYMYMYINIHAAYLPACSPLSAAAIKVNICTCKWHSYATPYTLSLFLCRTVALLHFMFDRCSRALSHTHTRTHTLKHLPRWNACVKTFLNQTYCECRVSVFLINRLKKRRMSQGCVVGQCWAGAEERQVSRIFCILRTRILRNILSPTCPSLHPPCPLPLLPCCISYNQLESWLGLTYF